MRRNAWTPRTLAAVTLATMLTGCATVGGGDAICGRLGPLLTAHAAALAEDGGPRSLSTGRALIATADAGCGG